MTIKKKLGPFSISQLDAGCEVRYDQDYKSEMGETAVNPVPYESLSSDHKHQLRMDLLKILVAMKGKSG